MAADQRPGGIKVAIEAILGLAAVFSHLADHDLANEVAIGRGLHFTCFHYTCIVRLTGGCQRLANTVAPYFGLLRINEPFHPVMDPGYLLRRNKQSEQQENDQGYQLAAPVPGSPPLR